MNASNWSSVDAELAEVARRSYRAYVDKDRAAMEQIIAEDFRFTSPLDNRLDRKTYFERCGRTANGSPNSSSSASFPTTTAFTSPMSAVRILADASKIPRCSPFAARRSSKPKSISAGHYRIRRRLADSCRIRERRPARGPSIGLAAPGRWIWKQDHGRPYSSFAALRSSQPRYLASLPLLSRTPAPPPFLGMKATPAHSSAARILATASAGTLLGAQSRTGQRSKAAVSRRRRVPPATNQ